MASSTSTFTPQEEAHNDECVRDSLDSVNVSLAASTARLEETCIEASADADADADADMNLSAEASRSPDVSSDSAVSEFAMGDHVFEWCSFAGIPAVYQHHGIVLDVIAVNEENNNNGNDGEVTIVDFYNWTSASDKDEENNSEETNNSHPENNNNSNTDMSSSQPILPTQHNCCLRTYKLSEAAKKWHKVEYSVTSSWKRHFSRSGTCTAATSSAPGLVRSRLQFLLDHPEQLPAYSSVRSNSECVAVWCKTGTWATLQACSWLSVTAASQAKSAVTLASVAASTQVTVPAAGLWGWLGYTSHVSLAATQPYLFPAIAAYGAVSVGLPLVALWRAKQEWTERTIALNQAFWDEAMDQPEVFAECLTEWSMKQAEES